MGLFGTPKRKTATAGQLWFALAAMLAMAVITPTLAWYAARDDARLRTDLIARGVRVPGMVSSMTFGKHGCGAAFDFTTREGQQVHRCYGNNLPFPEQRAITAYAAVDVVYDPTDPRRAIPEPFPDVPQIDPRGWTLRMAGISLAIFGVIGTILLIRLAFMPGSAPTRGWISTRN